MGLIFLSLFSLAWGKTPIAPPPTLVIENPNPAPWVLRSPALPVARAASTLFSIGNPSDEEQLILEYINRARANANTEALRLATTTDPDVLGAINYFSVDLAEMANQFADLSPILPPLSHHKNLQQMARLHSLDMYNNTFQAHDSSPSPPAPFTAGMHLSQRAGAVSYGFRNLGENIYAFADSPFHAHAGFEIDWGNEPYGMQSPPGHRLSIHNRNFTEIGIGVQTGTHTGVAWDTGRSTTVGPLLVTQDFGRPSSSRYYITGVAFLDVDADQFYGLNEGLTNIEVRVTGRSGTPDSTFYAVTTQSGGYSVPVATNGAYRVVFSSPGMTSVTHDVTVAPSQSRKVDLVLPYTAPEIQPPASFTVGRTNSVTFSLQEGADAYSVRWSSLINGPLDEDLNAGAANWTLNAAAQTYAFLQSSVDMGGEAFQFCHPNFNNTTAEFSSPLYVSSGAALQFDSRLRYATPAQTARVQISSDDGANWCDVYTQAGSDSSGESSFSRRSVSLSNYTGMEVRLRFIYDFPSGSAYTGTGSSTGWFVDNILVTQVHIVGSPTELPATTAGQADLLPPHSGSYLVQILPRNGTRTFPSGPGTVLEATVSVLPTSLDILSITHPASGVLRLRVQSTGNALTPANARIRWTPELGFSWMSASIDRFSDLGGGVYELDIQPPTNSRGFTQVFAE